MATQKTYTVWGSNPEKGHRFDKAEEWIAAVFESEEEATAFEKNEAKNYKFTGQVIYESRSGIRVASSFHSGRIFCEDMSVNKAKKELLNLNTRCSAYFKNPIKGGSYVKFDKDGFVEGKGYDFYSNEDNKIHESKKSLKPFVEVKLFETFLNDVKVYESAIDSLADEIDDAKVYDAFSDGKSVDARSTTKTWDDGVPVLKYIARASKKSIKLPKEFKVVDDTKYGWWYFFSAGKWHGIQQKDYGTPPFEY